MGLENLIDAMEQVKACCPDVLLLLGGTGSIANDLQSQIKERGLEQNVRRLGRVSEADLPLAYRAADDDRAIAVPGGFGLVTLESLASGTPALVTPIGGLPEVISRSLPNASSRSRLHPPWPACCAISFSAACNFPVRKIAAGTLQRTSHGLGLPRECGPSMTRL